MTTVKKQLLKHLLWKQRHLMTLSWPHNESSNKTLEEYFWRTNKIVRRFNTVVCELKWNAVFGLTETSPHSENWTIWESLLKLSKGNWLTLFIAPWKWLVQFWLHTACWCLQNTSLWLELIQSEYTWRPRLHHLLCVCPFRLELRHHREEELKAAGEILRSKLLLE